MKHIEMQYFPDDLICCTDESSELDNETSNETIGLSSSESEIGVTDSDEYYSGVDQFLSDPEQKHNADFDFDVKQNVCLLDNLSDDKDKPVYIGRDKITVWNSYRCGECFSFEGDVQRINFGDFCKCKKDKIMDETSAFFKIIDSKMLEEIVAYTNAYIECKLQFHKYYRKADVLLTTKAELLAMIGLLYLVGAKKAKHMNLLELWADDGTGLEIYRATMSYNRFLFLLNCLQFDDRSTRAMRLKKDKLALVRNIWEMFVQNCRDSYMPTQNLVIIDRLQAFRGKKCSFQQYTGNKSSTATKHGVRMVMLMDAQTNYTCNMELCYGTEQPDGPYSYSNDPAATIHELTDHLKDTFTNVVAYDGRYASYPLVVSLLNNGITFVGEVCTAQPELPLCFLPHKSRLVGSSLFGFRKKVTLVSYVDDKEKTIVMLSSRHQMEMLNILTNKPVIVENYNQWKLKMNLAEKIFATYSVSRKTRKWPLALFFTLLDVAGMNAQVLYNVCRQESSIIDPWDRKYFLKALALALLKPQLQERAKLKTLPVNIRAVILHQVGDCEDNLQDGQSPSKKPYYKTIHEKEVDKKKLKIKDRYFTCGQTKNINTMLKCYICSRFTYRKDMVYEKYTCDRCYIKMHEDSSDSSDETFYT